MIEPAARIKLDFVTEKLSQLDPENPSKPMLSCIEWTRTKPDFVDWLAYALHDWDYMRFKKCPPKPYYDIPVSEVHSNTKERFKAVFEAFPRDRWKGDLEKMLRYISIGQDFIDFCMQERLQMNQITGAEKAWRVAQRYATDGLQRLSERVQQDFTEVFASGFQKLE